MYSWKYIEKAALSLYYCAFSQQLYYVIKLIYATLARIISFGVIPRSSARLVTTQLLPVTALISSLRPTVILKRSAAHSVAHGSAYRPAGFCPWCSSRDAEKQKSRPARKEARLCSERSGEPLHCSSCASVFMDPAAVRRQNNLLITFLLPLLLLCSQQSSRVWGVMSATLQEEEELRVNDAV